MSSVFFLLACMTMATLDAAPTNAELMQLRDRFETRRDAMFELLKGQPLRIARKRSPLAPGRALYTRHYAYSVAGFALKALWLNEQLDPANEALINYARFYLGNQKARDDRDSFYWPADILCRIVEFFGRNGTVGPGRLRASTEDLLLEMMWAYSRNNSCLADAEFARSLTWHVHESENHHIQGFATVWEFSKFLAARKEYRNRTFDDGGTPAGHYAAWTAYAKEYLRERVRKGLFIEMANKGYNVMTLKGIYNFYDFADDVELRRLAKLVLDLYWATWAEEQIRGVRGGGASRIYQGRMSQVRGGDGIGRWAEFYLGGGTDKLPQNNQFTPLTSGYRMPLVVMDIALDAPGRGVYEVKQRRMGLAEKGYYRPPDYRMRTDHGGILRYSYCTPDFLLGTAMLEARPLEDWAMISSQNRWHGVLFRGHPDARIYPQCRSKGGRTYNQQWSVQSKGTLIAQRLRGSAGAKEMYVWFSRRGLSNRIERDGWVFAEAAGAYAAVRPANGGTTWEPAAPPSLGDWLHCTNPRTPVILEIARKAEFPNAGAFRKAVLALPRHFDGKVLAFTGLSGHVLTFFADQSQPPRINGRPVNYAPEMVFDSPFVQSKWNSGVVTIQKGKRKIVLDINAAGPAE